ncbi:MAG: hypothetical protein E7278_07670 [Lachnospiraceae bacterium]|nr:hypothetical protein [Lachnospiraceae bacterium]
MRRVIRYYTIAFIACVAIVLGFLSTGIEKNEVEQYYVLIVYNNSDKEISENSIVNKKIQKEFIDWAKKNKATIVYRGYEEAGCYYYAKSDFLKHNLSIEEFEDGKVYVKESLGSVYREDWNGESFCKVVNEELDADFFFPYEMANSVEGIYYTDCPHVDEIKSTLHAMDFTLTMKKTGMARNCLTIIENAILGSFTAKAYMTVLLFLLLNLWLMDMRFFSENRRFYGIHYLFGKKAASVYGGAIAGRIIILTVAFVAIISVYLWSEYSVYCMDVRYVVVLYVVLSLFGVASVINGMRFLHWGDFDE